MPKANPITKLEANGVGNAVQLPFKRKFLRFEGADDLDRIDVFYEEYYESPSGVKLSRVEKFYRLEGARFEQWDAQMGGIIRSSIESTLMNLVPIDAENGYVIPPA